MIRFGEAVQAKVPEEKQIIADFFGLSISAVVTEPQPDTYSVMLAGNEEAQAKYRECNPYGTRVSGDFGVYNFTKPLLVRWDGNKVQPV